MSKNKQSERVLNLPAGYFGMVLGIIGMGFAWRYASQGSVPAEGEMTP